MKRFILPILLVACSSSTAPDYVNGARRDSFFMELTPYACPAGAQHPDDCDERISWEDTLLTNTPYIHELSWTGTPYLAAKLLWPRYFTPDCTNSEGGYCYGWGIWRIDEMRVRMPMVLRFGATQQLHYMLLSAPIGGQVLADTSFTIKVKDRPADPPSKSY